MYQGKHLADDSGSYKPISARGRRQRRRNKRITTLALSLLLLFTVTVGGTVAFLTTQDDPVTNRFTPSFVDCSVTEQFNGTVKSDVNVANTGDTEAYIRVKLVSYRVNEEGQRIGGKADIPAFTAGKDWVPYGGYYYYTLPVDPDGGQPATDLIDRIELAKYSDVDGGRQVIEVIAEAIQSGPAQAVGKAWGVSITQGSVTAYPN